MKLIRILTLTIMSSVFAATAPAAEPGYKKCFEQIFIQTNSTAESRDVFEMLAALTKRNGNSSLPISMQDLEFKNDFVHRTLVIYSKVPRRTLEPTFTDWIASLTSTGAISEVTCGKDFSTKIYQAE